jgi:hypothetical protein
MEFVQLFAVAIMAIYVPQTNIKNSGRIYNLLFLLIAIGASAFNFKMGTKIEDMWFYCALGSSACALYIYVKERDSFPLCLSVPQTGVAAYFLFF